MKFHSCVNWCWLGSGQNPPRVDSANRYSIYLILLVTIYVHRIKRNIKFRILILGIDYTGMHALTPFQLTLMYKMTSWIRILPRFFPITHSFWDSQFPGSGFFSYHCYHLTFGCGHLRGFRNSIICAKYAMISRCDEDVMIFYHFKCV